MVESLTGGNVQLTKIADETYGHDQRAINRHHTKTFENEHGDRFMLSKTLDGEPPFYEAYGPYSREFEGVLPRLKVGAQDYWGEGLSWLAAQKRFEAAIAALGYGYHLHERPDVGARVTTKARYVNGVGFSDAGEITQVQDGGYCVVRWDSDKESSTVLMTSLRPEEER